ncbi:hypothetical protein F5Y15DRAFT_365918 [Xylariaceae sp. FL0016]|nr:hypothetical protein F5Y15DRAFT_365918 [Xylariaceae sp. FL0016]
MKLLRVLASCAPLLASLATPSQASADVVPDFDQPSTEYRPKFRYWFPDASVPSQSVIDDVEQIAEVGGGGLEFLSFFNYGLGPALTDWSIYGFGTEAFKGLLAAAMNASAAHGLVFDFAFGANQGAGVPSEIETLGLAKELVYGNTTIQAGEAFDGAVPPPVTNFNQLTGFMNLPEQWGPSDLIAVVAGKTITEVLLAEYFYLSILDETNLVDLTDLVDQGSLSWTAPEGNGTWVIFGIYERFTNQRSCVSVANATTALGNGSWMVDHWSSSGAEKMTDFWDEQILSDETIASLVAEVGEYAWEDSMEMQAALPWTDGLLSKFEEIHGYSIVKYLPILFHATNTWGGYLPPYNITYTLGEYVMNGGPYVMDYKTVLSQGYDEYVQHYNDWASSKGLQLSNQPGYNFPIDMTQAIAKVQVPELESLGFSENINQYRQFTGAAHLAGRNVISTEIGAVLGGAYKQRLPELKGLFDGSYAAGVNKMVIHGYAYSGEYVGTTWPGYTPFQYEYTEMWNQRQPAWRHFDDLMNYSSRNSLVMQSGIPKIDVAFYYFQIPYQTGVDVYPIDDMNSLGYTFEYLGPENLVSDQAVVSNGILAPEGPAFKALVIYNQTQITPAASAALIKFAGNGLPIYIVGSVPNTTVGITGQDEVTANMAELLTYDVVHTSNTDDFSASTLAVDGIPQRVSVQGDVSASNLYTFWTSNVESDSDYVYLFNSGADGVFNLSFSVTTDSIPYVLNAWTGDQAPLAVYENGTGSITAQIELKSNETTIISFSTPQTASNIHAISHSANVEAVRQTNCLEALLNDSSSAWVTLANGTRVTLPASNSSYQVANTLGSWSLIVDAYGPSPENNTLEGNVTTIDVGVLDELAPWTNISGIKQASGVGHYTTTFELSDIGQAAVMVDFGPVLHTLRAWVNGQRVAPVDPTNPVSDISDLVVSGNNTLKVEVTTSLFNAVKANVDRVSSIGFGIQTPTYYTDADWQEFGLVGPVEVRSLRKLCVA